MESSSEDARINLARDSYRGKPTFDSEIAVFLNEIKQGSATKARLALLRAIEAIRQARDCTEYLFVPGSTVDTPIPSEGVASKHPTFANLDPR